MADIVNANHDYIIKLNEREMKVVLKGLATLAGIKASPTPEDRELAAEMNSSILKNRVSVLKGQLEHAERSLEKANGLVDSWISDKAE